MSVIQFSLLCKFHSDIPNGCQDISNLPWAYFNLGHRVCKIVQIHQDHREISELRTWQAARARWRGNLRHLMVAQRLKVTTSNVRGIPVRDLSRSILTRSTTLSRRTATWRKAQCTSTEFLPRTTPASANPPIPPVSSLPGTLTTSRASREDPRWKTFPRARWRLSGRPRRTMEALRSPTTLWRYVTREKSPIR